MKLGRELARRFKPPCVILLEGELGSGKTTLVKGIVEGLGVAPENEVTSPSFTLVHEYGRESKVYHVDLYRVEGPRELETLGLDDVLDSQALVIVEWGEKLGSYARSPQVRIRLEHLESDDRRIIVERVEA
jgi:tRNA threonylcarbamoyladenosine biosynthesis protein TsaE